MNRSRSLFVVLIASAIVVLLIASLFRFRAEVASWLRGNPAGNTQTTSIASPEAVTAVPAAASAKSLGKFKPIWTSNAAENDGLGRYVCGAPAFAGFYALQQIQMSGLDVKAGFHLGIVPFELNDDYAATENERAEMLKTGQLDCLLTTMDSVALHDPGFITGFVGESAGADQMWSRGVKTLNDLKGKRIAFETNGPGEFFLYYLLNTVKIDPRKDVTLLPQPTMGAAVKLFNDQKADVVLGREPVIGEARNGGGQLMLSTRDFRTVVYVVATSRQALSDKRSLVDLFHDVWFDAVEAQENDFPASAATIARWGNNAYMGVKPNSAPEDLRRLVTKIAQANRADNARTVYTPSVLVQRLRSMREVWAGAGYATPTTDITQIVESRFIDAAVKEDKTDIGLPNKLVNGTYSLGNDLLRLNDIASVGSPTQTAPSASTNAPTNVPNDTQVVASLPCKRFEFVPNSTTLQAISQQELQLCAVDVLKQNVGLFVRVKGSSAWPGPKGSFTQAQVEAAAKARAQAIVDFLVSQGIKSERFVVEWALPPEDHWQTEDVIKQAQDRYVEITLLSSGL